MLAEPDYSDRRLVGETLSDVLAEDSMVDGKVPFGRDRALFSREEMAGAFNAHRMSIFSVEDSARRKVDARLTKPGHMYEVRIDADANDFLDWDKPLSEQSEKVRVAYASLRTSSLPAAGRRLSNEITEMERDVPDPTGGDIHTAAAEGLDGAHSATAEALRDAGIKGIRYLDQGSRASGDGTSNYVVFDDSLVTVTRKYAKARPDAASDGNGAAFRSSQELGRHLTTGPFSKPVQRLIDAGKIVLHEDESTLPGGSESSQTPVKRLTGHEIVGSGVPFGELRQAAQEWFKNNLRNTTVTTRLGWKVRFNRSGMSKATSKGEGLIRVIPALKEIIEQGELVESRPGDRQGIVAVHFIAAPVEVDGVTKNVVVGIREDPNALFHYELAWDNGRREVAESRSRTDGDRAEAPHTSLDYTPGELNIQFLTVRGKRSLQGLTDADGTIHLVASNLNRQTVQAVLLHEMFHAGGQSLVGDKAWAGLMARMKRIHERARAGKVGEWWAAALRRVPESTPEERIAEELAAYAIENRETAPAGIRELVDNILGRVKAFLLRRFGTQVGEVTPGRLRALAIAALRSGRTSGSASVRFAKPRPAPGFRVGRRTWSRARP
ncbi:hypothetical protein HNP73_000995 [Amaricoccus macauensis]|uniref:Large polyvalent protein-associated domain-containing protein n=1 Tax=Amaricoccus macauensis TaxID=57001 RepID=A0A840SJE2_9RHOB|nr:hypothetical protein [Amaricoccus macauensis]MBB5221074.1 hypothetical protein [Amaricoccus macauensis]